MADFVNLTNLIDKALLQTFKTQMDTKVNAALAEKEALGTAATLVGALTSLTTDAKGTVVAAINEVDSNADAAQAAATAAQGTADSALAKIGDLGTSSTVVDYVSAKVTEINTAAGSVTERVDALEAKDTELAASIKDNTDAIATLNGTGEGSVDKKITDAFNDFATKVSDDGVVNSYKELIDYVAEHGSEAATMAANIKANTDAISALDTRVGAIPSDATATTVVGYVDEKTKAVQDSLTSNVNTLNAAIEAVEKKADANATDISDLKTRVAALETWASAASLATEADILAMFA